MRQKEPCSPSGELERLAEALIRHDVRGDVEDGLDGDLQRMLGEALLDLVDGDLGGSR